MSHFQERKERNCLNCGTDVQGRYCHVCGQENIEPKETFWHLLTHFVYDITHFDGKFFSSLKYLLFRPGFLSIEYLKGRRASYLHPIRMYVFVSALFFLILFSFYQGEHEYVKVKDTTEGEAARTMKKLKKNRAELLEMINDTTSLEVTRASFSRMLPAVDSDIALLSRDTSARALDSLKTVRNQVTVLSLSRAAKKYKTVAAYDSAQAKLPEDQRDNFIVKGVEHQNYHLREKYDNDSKATMKAIVEKFKHLFPQMMFVSMPLYALALQLLYVRRRKEIYYVNHIVYTLHLYCATFIILLAAMLLTSLFQWVHWYTDDTENIIATVFTLAGLFYWYKSMRNFYGQRRKKTVLKYVLAMILSFFIVLLIFVIFFLLSVMTI